MEQSSSGLKIEELNLESLLAIVLWIFSYLLGSVSSAILVCKLFRLPDPRATGSHNPGATNVLRLGNKFAAAITLAGDVAKGVVPIMIARELELPESIAALCGFCAFLGHLYPVYFDFQGGKGVATALGVLAILHWPSMIIVAGIWVLVFISTHISSLASIASFFMAPWITLMSKPELFYPVLVLSLMLLFRHRVNMMQLIKGNEQTIGDGTKEN